MSEVKRNQWLDALSDEDSEQGDGYDSEAADIKPGLRATKKRKLSHDDEIDASDEENGDDVNASEDYEDAPIPTSPKPTTLVEDRDPHPFDPTRNTAPAQATEDHDRPGPPHEDGAHSRARRAADPPRRVLAPVSKARPPTRKSGVVYLSRIPPFMKPSVLRQLLAPHAPKHGLNRLFLTPEAPTSHAARVKSGGNKKRAFTDGWVEFCSKKEAKVAAETLNAQIVGGRKGGWYHDDVWNIKYLRGFKWDDLMAQMRNERAERDTRLRAEIGQTNRENKRFLANVERAKALKGMEEKRRAKRRHNDAEGDGEEQMPRTFFRQNEVKDKTATQPTITAETEKPKEDVTRVLSKIF